MNLSETSTNERRRKRFIQDVRRSLRKLRNKPSLTIHDYEKLHYLKMKMNMARKKKVITLSA